MANVLLIRHGARDRESGSGLPDHEQPLSPQGRQEIEKLVQDLTARKLRPTLYLTSRYAHAVETARLLCEGLKGDASSVVELDALTPNLGGHGCFAEIKAEADKRGCNLRDHPVVAIVAHQPRLNQLFAYLTWPAAAPMKKDYGWMVSVTADNPDDFEWGNGEGSWSS
jgi:phosphohistidine phosphatase SixA